MANILYISYNGMAEHISQSQVLPYVKGLSGEGFKFTILSYEKKEALRDHLRIGKIESDLSDFGIDWVRLKYHKRPGILAKIIDICIGSISAVRIVRNKKIDFIHARSTVPASIAFVVSGICKIRYIFDMRGLLADEYVDGGIWRKGSFKYRLVARIERKLLMSADRVVVLTERIKKILLGDSRYLGSKDGAGVTVIPCCVDLTKFRMTEKKDITLANDLGLKGEFVFGYLGSLGTWYMVDEMVEFFRIAKDIFAPARFLFITQTGSEHVYGAVGRSGMDKELFRVIEVGREDVPRALSLVDVGVFFIKPSFSKQASSPTKLAEFLACGVPVVINSGIGDTADVVKDNKIGVVLDGFSVDLYSKATSQLKGLIPEGEPLRKKCRDAAERYYALKNACRLYKKVYSDMSVK